VAVETVQRVLDLLNSGIHPKIPCQGSVGASGDLAPLSHLALVLIGEGEAEVDGKLMSGKAALQKKNLKPLTLGPKEALALINGTQMMTSVGLGTLLRAKDLLRQANLACAMSLEALRGSTAPFDPSIHAVRPHAGQQSVAREILAHLTQGGASAISQSHENC